MGYVYLTIAIIAEVIATTALKASDGFTNLVPSIIVVVGYAVAFYGLSMVLKSIPIGIAYAIWAGLGMVLVTIVGMVVFGQKLDLPAIAGIVLIISGVIVMNVFSKSIGH